MKIMLFISYLWICFLPLSSSAAMVINMSYGGPCTLSCEVAGLNTNDPVLGAFSFDDSILTGSSSQTIFGSSLLSLDVTFGTAIYKTSDILPTGGLVIDGSGSVPVLIGSAGAIAALPNGDSASFFAKNININVSGISLISDGVWSVVPIPSAVWLFGSGLLGLVGLARRKKPA